MHLITLILGFMLLPTGSALRCYECNPGDTGVCTDEIQTCPGIYDKCRSITMRFYTDPVNYVDVTEKKCVPVDECVTGSMRSKEGIVFFQCCSTDLCNMITSPVDATPNGLKCYTCDGDDCSHIAPCTADQDHCSTVTDSEGKVEPIAGCMSKSICDRDGEAVCCKGHLCNDADFRAKSSGTGYALECYECNPGGNGTCTDERKTCTNSSDKCGAATTRLSLGPVGYMDVTEKKCVPFDKCVTGSARDKDGIHFSQCCSTDLCNVIEPPVDATLNGLKCYTCLGDDCSHVVPCTADQDHCFTGTGEDSEGKVETHAGCVSKSICDNLRGVCCKGDLCNDADFRAISSGTTAVTPIISAILASLLLVL